MLHAPHRCIDLPTHYRVIDACPAATAQAELLLCDLHHEGLLLPGALAVVLGTDGDCDAPVGGGQHSHARSWVVGFPHGGSIVHALVRGSGKEIDYGGKSAPTSPLLLCGLLSEVCWSGYNAPPPPIFHLRGLIGRLMKTFL
jgi:hypothetical protein